MLMIASYRSNSLVSVDLQQIQIGPRAELSPVVIRATGTVGSWERPALTGQS